MQTVYQRLMSTDGLGESVDRHVFACVIAVCRADPARTLSEGTGLAPGRPAYVVRNVLSGLP